jgi:hypothetical protein
MLTVHVELIFQYYYCLLLLYFIVRLNYALALPLTLHSQLIYHTYQIKT